MTVTILSNVIMFILILYHYHLYYFNHKILFSQKVMKPWSVHQLLLLLVSELLCRQLFKIQVKDARFMYKEKMFLFDTKFYMFSVIILTNVYGTPGS